MSNLGFRVQSSGFRVNLYSRFLYVTLALPGAGIPGVGVAPGARSEMFAFFGSGMPGIGLPELSRGWPLNCLVCGRLDGLFVLSGVSAPQAVESEITAKRNNVFFICMSPVKIRLKSTMPG